MNCRRCGAERPETRANWPLCASCRSEYERTWRENRKAQGDRVISTKMPRQYFLNYNRSYYSRADLKQRNAQRQREYVTRPHVAPKVEARLITRNAIRRGELTRLPCEVCGTAKSHAHHEDYSKPLEVVWLCRAHHEALHHAKAEGRQ